MHRSAWTILAITAVSIGATTACGVSGDCHVTGTCGQFDGTTSAGASSSTSSSSGEGGARPGCVPSPSNERIDSSCGIFVSSSMGKDTNNGSEKAPVKTLGHALALAHGNPVYACGEEFNEAVVVSSKAILFGALDCHGGWKYDQQSPTKLTAGHDQVPLTLNDEATVADFAITAAEANEDSGSSIGILASADLELERVRVDAGRAHGGANGETQKQVAASAPGKTGTNDDACTATNGIIGGDGGSQLCDGMDVSGGTGGTGVTSGNGGPGGNGSPDGAGTFPTDGHGGAGQSGSACGSGGVGDEGSPGNPGTGAHGVGKLTTAGYVPPTATAGASSGTPGQGGGGGGGGKPCASMKAGPSGGGGGGGGCGGAPGKAAQSGGSSIGIAAVGAKLTLTDVTITTDQGGDGGLGGDGQAGGNGGQPGPAGGSGACGGSNGGQGGRGGSGGGGAGGHSIGIALQSSTIATMTDLNVKAGGNGAGALGGDGDATQAVRGDDGKSCKTLDMQSGDCSS